MRYLFISLFCLFASISLVGQNRITINENKVIHLISKEKITYLQVGNPDLILAEIVSEHSNLARIKAVKTYEEESSIALVTGGKLYSIGLIYGESKEISYQLDEFEGLSANLYHGTLMREEDLKKTCRFILSHKRTHTNIRKSKSDGIQFGLQNIYLLGDALFFELEIENKTNMAYDVESFRWWIDDQRRVKATNTQEYQIHPKFQYRGLKRIPAKSKAREVFVLPKFTITDKKILRIELLEKALGNTGRKLHLELKNKDILKAESL
jgi:conjugative transposon TraN protein